jgi:hypothetical protein
LACVNAYTPVKKICCIVLFSSVAVTSQCQFIDSLQAIIRRKPSYVFSFDSRDSYIDNNYANIFGIMAGVCFDNKFTIGGGYNTLSSPIYKNQYLGDEAVRSDLHFAYFSYFVEYTINLTKHWELDLPVLIGIGSSSYQYTINDVAVVKSRELVMPLEPQVTLGYNINKYIEFSTQVGYRFMLINNNLLGYNFNSVTYSVGLSVSPFEIYAHLFPDTKLGKLIQSNG